MTFKQLTLISVAVALSAFAQISLRCGMSNHRVQGALDSTSLSQIAWTVGTNVWVLSGIVQYVISMAVWLLVLARVEVSQAYPFVGAGFLITLAFGYFFLGESVNLYRIAGTILVAAGIILISLK
jgi:multidrug transporter EmrE-like cation transporter